MSMAVCWAFAQQKTYWTPTTEPPSGQVIASRATSADYKLYALDLSTLHVSLNQAPSREAARGNSTTLISFPTPEGKLKTFRVVEASVLHPELATKYPGIRSFAGQGVEDPSATIRFSVSPQQGFHGMILSGNRKTYYIDPYTKDQSIYKVYGRENANRINDFECLTSEEGARIETQASNPNGKTNDKKLRKYRLALSCNAEYGNIFAGSTGTDAEKKGRILAQMNITMTRVNGVYERDLSITMEIIPNNTAIMYYGSTTTDPWSNEWNTKTQQVIDAAIGSANYDIGHNFNTTGGGNAGCIGCVCTSGSKGSGYTGRSDPTGDAFDIDYVAHEMGHQFGGYHTQSNSACRSGSGTTEVEPGSGSTIMGYAGICSANVQNNSDAYFAYVNIRDISANIQTGTSSGCAQVTNIVNNPPTANAGLDYVIPKATAFVLRGQGSDPDGDAITYSWEQNDPGNPNSNAAPTSTRTVGPMFRSIEGTTSPDRYFPKVSDVVANNLAPTWEVIPSVARTLNFSLTTRDNKAGGGQTSDDLMTVTVNGTAGPFVVSAPNTAVSWAAGSTQTVTWSVASTNVAPVNCTNVNIVLSTDGGFTYPVTILANTPNDGTQSITVPNNVATTCRIKIEAVANIFYDISNVNFTITGAPSCTATVPTGLAASAVTSTGATLNWNAVASATYDVQYRVVGAPSWTTVAASTNSTTLSGLTSSTQYEAQVRSNCTSTSSAYSASVNFTTGAGCVTSVPTGLAASGITSSGATLNWNVVASATYDVQYRVVGAPSWTTVAASTNSTVLSGLTASTQYEAQVRSKCTSTTSAYSASVNFTTSAVQLVYCASKGNSVADEYIGRVQLGTINNLSGANAGYGNFTAQSTNLSKSTAYTITVTPTWTGSVYAEGYSVWIDYNIDGDFADAGEQVWSKAAATTTPASGLFTVPATASTGSTRMRVSMKYNGVPTSCETFSYGEVEDYTVNIQGAAPDTQAPTSPANFAVSGITQTTANLSWTASTDNVGVTGYEIRVNGALNGTATGTTYSLTGLTAATTYSVSVTAKDAAGNSSTAATINVTTSSVSLVYCASKGNSVADEYIGRVQIGSINNLSGSNAGYGNFTALSTNLGRNTVYTITITPTWTGTLYNEGYAVWIDYNSDGDFTDAGEQVWTKTASKTTPVSGSFTVPAAAPLGATRMRVSMKYNGVPTSCETFSYGEVEDYTVNIQSTARPDNEINVEAETDIFPNPVTDADRLYVKTAPGVVVKAARVISGNGNTLHETTNIADGIEVIGFGQGMYILMLDTDQGVIAKKFFKK
jgi:hypothetical protein